MWSLGFTYFYSKYKANIGAGDGGVEGASIPVFIFQIYVYQDHHIGLTAFETHVGSLQESS
jgi:hypothetical protein